MKNIISLGLMCLSLTAHATPVNINRADAATIANALTGIGLKKAEAIVQYRTEHGPFKSVTSLTDVSGIGDKTVQANLADILLEDKATIPTENKAINLEAKK